MPKTSNLPKRFDAPEIRNLTLDEINVVTGGYTAQKRDGTYGGSGGGSRSSSAGTAAEYLVPFGW